MATSVEAPQSRKRSASVSDGEEGRTAKRHCANVKEAEAPIPVPPEVSSMPEDVSTWVQLRACVAPGTAAQFPKLRETADLLDEDEEDEEEDLLSKDGEPREPKFAPYPLAELQAAYRATMTDDPRLSAILLARLMGAKIDEYCTAHADCLEESMRKYIRVLARDLEVPPVLAEFDAPDTWIEAVERLTKATQVELPVLRRFAQEADANPVPPYFLWAIWYNASSPDPRLTLILLLEWCDTRASLEARHQLSDALSDERDWVVKNLAYGK